MKRILSLILAAICTVCLLSSHARAETAGFDETVKQIREDMRRQRAPKFCHVDVNGKLDGAYASWTSTRDGLKFRLKMKNCSDCEEVDAYTFEISVQNAYEEDIQQKADDGCYYDSLLYTGYNTFRKGVTAYTDYFLIETREKVRYVTVKLVKYHTDSGTFEVDEDDQIEYTWTIK